MAKRIIVVEGLPGSGRTTLIAEYLEQHDDEFGDATHIDIDTYLKYKSVTKESIEKAQEKMLRECNRHIKAETDWIILETVVNWLDKKIETIAKENGYAYSKEILVSISTTTEAMAKRSRTKISPKEIETLKSIKL
jgi:tRNA uridine 5-carbamoylmethylation protein Kti12